MAAMPARCLVTLSVQRASLFSFCCLLLVVDREPIRCTQAQASYQKGNYVLLTQACLPWPISASVLLSPSS